MGIGALLGRLPYPVGNAGPTDSHSGYNGSPLNQQDYEQARAAWEKFRHVGEHGTQFGVNEYGWWNTSDNPFSPQAKAYLENMIKTTAIGKIENFDSIDWSKVAGDVDYPIIPAPPPPPVITQPPTSIPGAQTPESTDGAD